MAETLFSLVLLIFQLSVLHNRVSNVDWKRSRGKIDELFGGSHWESFIKNISSRPVGSGCIAEVHLSNFIHSFKVRRLACFYLQVYKGEMNVDAFETNTGVKAGECGSRGNVDIAIKVSYYCNSSIY